MMNNLIESIGEQLNIPKSDGSDWLCRVVYSIAGQLALASLWDRCEDETSVSIQHFKSRIAQIFEAYEDIDAKVKDGFPSDKGILIDEMYAIYKRNGFLYHSAYQIVPAARRTARYGDILLHRGFSPDEKLYMSGLGFYSLKKDAASNSIADLFGLQKQSFENDLDELLSFGEWKPIDWPDNAEFLRLDPPFSRGYWQRLPHKDGRVSLARYGELNKIFVFYRYHKGEYQQKTIPEWRICDYFSDTANHYGEYRRIAAALLKRYGTFPDVTAKNDGSLIVIHMGYRLPPAEEEFFKLYSWPVTYDFSEAAPPVFARKMAKQIYPLFKYELEWIGYRFVEE